MNTTLIYLDEILGYKNSFYITTSIWGNPLQIDRFEKGISKIILRHQKDLGKNFIAFHANRLNAKNWNRISPAYLKVLELLFESIYKNEINILLFIESKQKRENNSTIMKSMLKKALNDTSNDLGKQFKYVDRRDLPALYHRIDNIYNFLLHRDLFGGPNQKFHYHPDSKGKILRYKDKMIPLYREYSNGKSITHLYNFYDVIAILANPMMKFAEDIMGWEKPICQKITKYEPLNDKDSKSIQTCDLLTNFFLHFLRMKLGIKDQNSILKGKWLDKQNIFNETQKAFLPFFKVKDGEVFYKDDNLKHCISLHRAG
jgi:hypothetical protein